MLSGSATIILEDLTSKSSSIGFQPLLSMPRGFALLYPAAPPSVFAYFIGSYTALAVALVREYVVELQGVLSGFLRS